MPAISFVPATATGACAVIAGIEAEYLRWLASELARAFADAAPASAPLGAGTALAGQASGPWQVAYLIEVDGQPAGMCGLRDVGHAAEIKRLYVRPAYRGLQLGHRALQRLLAEADRRGQSRICLDTAPFMHAAHRLYEAHGFSDCAAYEGTEVPPRLRCHWRFMQRSVPGPPHPGTAPQGA